MLRTYAPIMHPITALQLMLEYLVCEVWCKANAASQCHELLKEDFKELYLSLDWLKEDTDKIYDLCKTLSEAERKLIIDTFHNNNQIEDLCNGDIPIMESMVLPPVVQKEMQNLLEKFYSRLLDIKKVPGEKLDYYNQLIKTNKFKTCPVCGLFDIETENSKYIEDYDHFFPKTHYPFAAVNFNNLIPTCDKCNKKHKGSKKPLEHNGKAYYPFETDREEIKVSLKLDKIEFDKDEKLTAKANIDFTGDKDKNSTWDWLYNIIERYSDIFTRDTYTWLRMLKKEIEFSSDKTIEEIIDFKIRNYTIDRFDEKKFLKIALLEEIKNKPEWVSVYT